MIHYSMVPIVVFKSNLLLFFVPDHHLIHRLYPHQWWVLTVFRYYWQAGIVTIVLTWLPFVVPNLPWMLSFTSWAMCHLFLVSTKVLYIDIAVSITGWYFVAIALCATNCTLNSLTCACVGSSFPIFPRCLPHQYHAINLVLHHTFHTFPWSMLGIVLWLLSLLLVFFSIFHTLFWTVLTDR